MQNPENAYYVGGANNLSQSARQQGRALINAQVANFSEESRVPRWHVTRRQQRAVPSPRECPDLFVRSCPPVAGFIKYSLFH